MDEPSFVLSQSNNPLPRSYSTISINSSFLDIPSTMYMLEDASIKSSTASFQTTGRSETPLDPPTPYDEILRDQIFLARANQSPAALLQLRARSKSLGMIGTTTNDIGISPVSSPMLTPPMSPSPSFSSSVDLSIMPFPDIPTPPYEDLVDGSTPQLRHSPSSQSLREDSREVENDYLPPFRFSVHPRPEEGREILPDYSCSVFRSGIVNQKIECVYPGLPAKKREWIRVYMLVLGTGLR